MSPCRSLLSSSPLRPPRQAQAAPAPAGGEAASSRVTGGPLSTCLPHTPPLPAPPPLCQVGLPHRHPHHPLLPAATVGDKFHLMSQTEWQVCVGVKGGNCAWRQVRVVHHVLLIKVDFMLKSCTSGYGQRYVDVEYIPTSYRTRAHHQHCPF